MQLQKNQPNILSKIVQPASDVKFGKQKVTMAVLEEHRGQGLGEAMVREMLDAGELAHVRWLLHTRDMQRLYAKLGFGGASERLMERAGSAPPTAGQRSAKG